MDLYEFLIIIFVNIHSFFNYVKKVFDIIFLLNNNTMEIIFIN